VPPRRGPAREPDRFRRLPGRAAGAGGNVIKTRERGHGRLNARQPGIGQGRLPVGGALPRHLEQAGESWWLGPAYWALGLNQALRGEFRSALETNARTTYYFQLATCCGAAGGPVTITMQEVPPLSADIHVAHRGRISDAGLVRMSGKVRCNRQTPPGTELVVQGTLTQGDARGWLVPVHFSHGCSKRWMPWSTTVQVLSIDGFQAGKAALSATVFACDEFDTCAEPVTKATRVRLR